MSEQVHASIEAKDAIRIAKTHVATLFDDEKVQNIGLEELVYDEITQEFRVTIGFNRPWDMQSAYAALRTGVFETRRPLQRTFKVVTVDARDGRVISMTNRLEQPCMSMALGSPGK